MLISELAKQAGLNIQSIRFYERQGLIRKPPRTSSGYRAYNQFDLERITFIKWCQPLGFTLKEVKELIQLHAAVANLSSAHAAPKPKELQRIICMAHQKSADLQTKIKLLKSADHQLTAAIKKLQTQACPASVPISRPTIALDAHSIRPARLARAGKKPLR